MSYWSHWPKLLHRSVLLASLVVAALVLTLGATVFLRPGAGPMVPGAIASRPDAPSSPDQVADNPQTALLPVYNPAQNANNQVWDIPVHFVSRREMHVDAPLLLNGRAHVLQTAPRQLELELYDRAGSKLRSVYAWHPLRYEAVAAPRPTEPGPRAAADGKPASALEGRQAGMPEGIDQADPHLYDPYQRIQGAGDGHLYLPFDPRVSVVRIVDHTFGDIELGRISLEGAARRYCVEQPASPFCRQRVPNATLYFEPYSTTVGTGEVFTLELRARKVAGLYGGQLAVTYDANVVKVVDLDPSRPGAQIRPGDFPKPDEVLRNAANNTTGRLEYYFTLTGEKPGVTGTGTVAYLRLRADAAGQTLLHITETVLSDPQSLRIPATTENALVTVLSVPLVTINGQVELERRLSSAGASVCSDARCTTTDASGRFTLAALAGRPVHVFHPSYLRAMRIIPANATGTLTWPKIKLLSGDFDKDDRVDIVDAAMIGQRFNLRYNAAVPDPRWLKACDITDDDLINILDMVGVQFNMLKTAPLPWPTALAQSARLNGVAAADTTLHLDLAAAADTIARLKDSSAAVTTGRLKSTTAPTVTVRLVPGHATADGLKADVPLDIVVENVAKLYGYRVQLRFDPARLMVKDMNPDEDGIQSAVGEFLDPFNTFILLNRADNTTGIVDLSVTQTAPAVEGKDGTGVLGTITFRGRAGGTSTVSLAEVVLVDDTTPVPGTIPNDHTDATVTVNNALNYLYVPNVSQTR